VLDADALNLISDNVRLRTAVKRRTAATIITPHPAEAARLLHTTTAKVQADRLSAALELAKELHAWTVLKGNGSIVAGPDGTWWINTSGHPGMASAGMGDALTGLVASLAAQGANPGAALRAAVWLHGAAGDAVSARHAGPLGTLASDVIHEARRLLNQHLAPA
jgi:ADP-dependent NAD(P)H-hydrate dehydratase / NAD(P)H-hydrate epimerase